MSDFSKMPDGTAKIVLEEAINTLADFARIENRQVVDELIGSVFSAEEAGILKEWFES